jgi:hypothetical protein
LRSFKQPQVPGVNGRFERHSRSNGPLPPEGLLIGVANRRFRPSVMVSHEALPRAVAC